MTKERKRLAIDWIHQGFTSVTEETVVKVSRGFDAVLFDDKKTDAHYSSNYLCSCFIFFKPSLETLSKLELWLELKKNENKNQLAFNRAISQKISILPRSVFPNGHDFDRFQNSSAWIHANYRK